MASYRLVSWQRHTLSPADSNWHQMTFPRSQMAQSPKWQRGRIPGINKIVKSPKYPKDEKASSQTKPKAKNNSTQALRCLSFQKKIPHHSMASTTFVDLLNHLRINIAHFQSLSYFNYGTDYHQTQYLAAANTLIK